MPDHDYQPRSSLSFSDPQLQQCYDGNIAHTSDPFDEGSQVRALMAVHDFFHTQEGPHSSRVHQTIWQLLLPKLRPALRHWYRRSGADHDSTGFGLREHLSQLAGEPLENGCSIPNKHSRAA